MKTGSVLVLRVNQRLFHESFTLSAVALPQLHGRRKQGLDTHAKVGESTERRGEHVPEFILVAEAAILRAFRERLFSKHAPLSAVDLLRRVALRVPLRESDLETALDHLIAAHAIEPVGDTDDDRVQLTDAGRDRVSKLGFGIRPNRNDWRALAQCMRQVEMRLGANVEQMAAR